MNRLFFSTYEHRIKIFLCDAKQASRKIMKERNSEIKNSLNVNEIFHHTFSRYCTASAIWAGRISGSPARSAIVRATLITLK